MKYLLLFALNISLAAGGFSQNSEIVTLVFTPTGNNYHKNYEAVVDYVSYYSYNSANLNNLRKPINSGNTISLNNLRPGKHSVKVYTIKSGSRDKRAGSLPVYSSTFTVKHGFDTKIAVNNDGRVQFSETISNNHSISSSVVKNDDSVSGSENNNYPKGYKNSDSKNSPGDSDDFEKQYKNRQFNTASVEENDSSIPGSESVEGYERHSRKRPDTAIVYEAVSNDNDINTRKNSPGKTNKAPTDRDLKSRVHGRNGERKSPMNEDQFNDMFESVRNEWHPGQKMKTLDNEFLNAEDNFSTAQAKKLIQLITEEGNRLKLAKSVYPCITDPENFSELNNLLRQKKSRDVLEAFVSAGGKD